MAFLKMSGGHWKKKIFFFLILKASRLSASTLFFAKNTLVADNLETFFYSWIQTIWRLLVVGKDFGFRME